MKVFDAWCARLRERLILPDALEKADLIFVLAGHRNRKVYGARLFRDGWAPRLVMSTGDPPYIARVLQREVPASILPNAQAEADLREAAARPSPREGQFFACLDQRGWSVEPIEVGWFGTLSEIKAFASWLQQRTSINSVLVVSMGMHLKRLRMCCGRLLPEGCRVRFIAVTPESADGTPLGGRPPREGPREILLEHAKALLYRVLLLFAS